MASYKENEKKGMQMRGFLWKVELAHELKRWQFEHAADFSQNARQRKVF
jgi:hypothetical protein